VQLCRCQNCAKCEVQFDEKLQIHHCRACGRGFCESCSSHRRPVPERNWGMEPVRVCDVCYESPPRRLSGMATLTVIDMSKHHCILRYIDNSSPCNGWWCSVLWYVRNCRFIIIIIIIYNNQVLFYLIYEMVVLPMHYKKGIATLTPTNNG